MNFDYSNKVALITGGSAGIGEETALKFAKAGADVVIVGRNGEKLKKVAEECQKVSPYSKNPLAVIADLNSEDQVENIVKQTIEKYNQIDVMVLCAFQLYSCLLCDDDFLEGFTKSMNVKIKATAILVRAAMPYLEKSKGTVITFSSVSTKVLLPDCLNLAMADASIEVFTKLLAKQYVSKGIRANCISPGLVLTSMTRNYYDNDENEINKFAKSLPNGRFATTEDITNLIMFLASKHSEYINGEVIVIDGTWSFNQ